MIFNAYGVGDMISFIKDLKAEENRQNFRKFVNNKTKKRGKR